MIKFGGNQTLTPDRHYALPKGKTNMRIWNAVCGLLLFFLLGACNEFPSYRYRLTVVVDTPEGPKQGSTVIEVHTHTEPLPGPHIQLSAVGEAAVIDLGQRGLLFALPRGDPDLDWASQVYTYLTPPPPKGLSTSEVASYSVDAARNSKTPIKLPRYFTTSDPSLIPSGYPLLVRFQDPSDYRTLERVDPDNLAATFGTRVRLRKMTVQITQDDRERRVIRYLPWLPDIKGPFDKDYMMVRKSGEFRNNLSSRDFDPEICQMGDAAALWSRTLSC